MCFTTIISCILEILIQVGAENSNEIVFNAEGWYKVKGTLDMVQHIVGLERGGGVLISFLETEEGSNSRIKREAARGKSSLKNGLKIIFCDINTKDMSFPEFFELLNSFLASQGCLVICSRPKSSGGRPGGGG